MPHPKLFVLICITLLITTVGCVAVTTTPTQTPTEVVRGTPEPIGLFFGSNIASVSDMLTIQAVLTSTPSPKERNVSLYIDGTPFANFSAPTPTITGTYPLPTDIATYGTILPGPTATPRTVAVVYHIGTTTFIEYPPQLFFDTTSVFWCSSVGTSGNWIGVRVDNDPVVKKICW